MTSRAGSGWFFIIFTGVMFGSLGLCTSYLTSQGVSPFVCAAIPFTLTALLALTIGWRRLGEVPWGEGLALGAVNGGIPPLLFNIGFAELPASVVTIVLALGPLFTALTAHLAFHDDRFNGAKVGGMAVSFVGVALLAGAPTGSASGWLLVVVLVGTIVSGASLVWVRRMAAGHDPLSVLPAMMLGAAIVSVLVSVATGNAPWLVEATVGQLWLLAGMGAAGVATFLGSLKANEINPASRAGLMGYVVPLVGVLGGVLLFKETLSFSLLGGGALVIAGVALVGRANRTVAPVLSG
ncbi:MAG TPA: DMT family transporter [Acidimicrobiia bacterium]|nr:DMT family transporter [Acidimicrobiia bacterium]